jgi:adenylate cyclase
VPGPERRLAAVVAADMVGYSRLMEADETGTLARLKTHRIELIDPAIVKNRGRMIKTTGDGMLVEFHSVVDAVTCAAEIQRRMARRNADVSPARWIQFRIGINLGDVIVEENDIFGDGVNVAARLETLAEPGGICVSGAVRDQVGDRLENVAFEDLGDQSVKNIARPIRVFRVRLERDATTTPEGAKDAAVTAATTKKPSIAVLPLVNMSGDPEQECGRPHRGHHYRAVALSRPARHLAQFDVRAQGQGGQGTGSRTRIRGRLRPRGERAKGGRSYPRHRAADRWRN